MASINRRAFLQGVSLGVAGTALGTPLLKAEETPTGNTKPNILLIITDDQGYGDLGRHGNPALKTPALDRLYDESLRLTRFYASPVCSPTRACLMTGRYNYRTGVVDTYAGRSIMASDETTLPQLLKTAGYRTGIFGKWHLGDAYPHRPMDRGFEESLVHYGGGIGQPSDPEYFERNDTYFDPVLEHNGAQQKTAGYCTDIFTESALRFMADRQDAPFFAYVSYNAPHTPLQVPEAWSAPYRTAGLEESTALLYGMLANTDHNIGKLLDFLDETGLARNTLVIFMTDNGAQDLGAQDRYNAALRGWKGTVYEGGIRVPCFMRWPEILGDGREMNLLAAHIDIVPTLLDVCGVSTKGLPALDGRSLLKPLRGALQTEHWPERNLFIQWHRGDAPEPFRNSAVLTQRWKLVNGEELYDIEADPGESSNLADDMPELVARLRAAYEAWFADVSSERGYDPIRVHIGSDHQNPVTLTRQDWRTPENWTRDATVGHWELYVERSGEYAAAVTINPVEHDAVLVLKVADVEVRQEVPAGEGSVRVSGLSLPSGDARLDCFLDSDGQTSGARFVTVKRL